MASRLSKRRDVGEAAWGIPESHARRELRFYNFVRPHMALDGQTPAEAAGIDLNLEGNRWMQLIKAASQRPTKE